MEWKLELEEFAFAGCMHNHTGMGGFAVDEEE
jgi:hypothetical protein